MFRSLIVTLLMFFLQNGSEFYQQALVQDRAAGNLEAAIQPYQDAARYAGNDRTLAAQAMLGAARCYEKLGQAKARELYEEIARMYADQPQQAAQARDRAHALQPREHGLVINIDDNTTTLRLDVNEKLVQVAPGMYWSKQPAFDPDKPITITGTVTQVTFVNPSISISVHAAGPDGKMATYLVKGGAPNTLIATGFTPRMIRPGDTVTVEGLRAKDPDSLTIGAATVTLPDGRKIFLGASVSGQ